MPWDVWLIFFALAVVLPWRGRARLKELLSMPSVSTTERLVFYAMTIAFQWGAAMVVAWRAWVHGYTALQLGLALHGKARIMAASVLGAGTIAALQWLNLRRVSRLP